MNLLAQACVFKLSATEVCFLLHHYVGVAPWAVSL